MVFVNCGSFVLNCVFHEYSGKTFCFHPTSRVPNARSRQDSHSHACEPHSFRDTYSAFPAVRDMYLHAAHPAFHQQSKVDPQTLQ